MNDASQGRWHLPGLILLCAAVLVLGGCSESDQIRRYSVEKPVPKDRMLAAIVPHAEQAWFFKLSGANETLAGLIETFSDFIGTVRISADEPTWELPAGWIRTPGNQARFATIQINTEDEPLALSVTRLPKMADDTQLLVQNINRWRGQLQLSPISEDRLAAESVQLELDADSGLTATLINIVGNLESAGGMGAGGTGSSGSRMSTAPIQTAPVPKIVHETPDGWQAGQLVSSRGGFSIPREAAFDVVDGNARVEITVTQLPTSPQALPQNISRWRQQVGLTDDVGSPELKEVDVGGVGGVSMELIGQVQAILGVIAMDQGRGWFIKLYGDRDLALRERERFNEFVDSIEFKGGE